MKKIYLLIVFFFVTANSLKAQHKKIDTLRLALSKATVDTVRLNILMQLGFNYFIPNPDSCITFSLQGYDLAVKYNRPLIQARALITMGNAYANLGDYAKAIQFYFKALRIEEKLNDIPGIQIVYGNIGATYVQDADYKNALRYLQLTDKLWEPYILTHKLKTFSEREAKAVLYVNFGECYLYTNKIDSADHYLQISYQDAKQHHYDALMDNIERDLGEVEIARGRKGEALKHLNSAVTIAKSADDPEMLSIAYLSMSKLYHNDKRQDTAEYYAKQALETARAGNFEQDVLNAGKVLYGYYDEDHNLPEAYKYYKLTTAAKDSLYSQDRVKQLLSMDFEEKQRKLDIATAQSLYQEKVRSYALAAGLLVLLLLALIFWRNNRQNRRAKIQIQKTLDELQLTQRQLIQSEKMASLGVLTAGIAHEIQNPLNFVNNFAEINTELIDELKLEIADRNFESVNAIAEDIKQNEKKISMHGKRADSIVKGMLEHSQISSGRKEPTDINILADEYLRLAYHGFRAKDKSFRAELITRFDEKPPILNVVPQDIGRVLLNIFNNAFYATQKKQTMAAPGFKPTVEVTTSKEKDFILISVKDNGTGIPDDIKDKIMQPFFTTKPTGEGTGLGLSISYDIVAKAYGGSIDIDTVKDEYAIFIVKLPISDKS